MLNKSLQKVKFLCFFSNFYFFHVFIYIEDISISVYRRSWMNNMNVDSVKNQMCVFPSPQNKVLGEGSIGKHYISNITNTQPSTQSISFKANSNNFSKRFWKLFSDLSDYMKEPSEMVSAIIQAIGTSIVAPIAILSSPNRHVHNKEEEKCAKEKKRFQAFRQPFSALIALFFQIPATIAIARTFDYYAYNKPIEAFKDKQIGALVPDSKYLARQARKAMKQNAKPELLEEWKKELEYAKDISKAKEDFKKAKCEEYRITGIELSDEKLEKMANDNKKLDKFISNKMASDKRDKLMTIKMNELRNNGFDPKIEDVDLVTKDYKDKAKELYKDEFKALEKDSLSWFDKCVKTMGFSNKRVSKFNKEESKLATQKGLEILKQEKPELLKDTTKKLEQYIKNANEKATKTYNNKKFWIQLATNLVMVAVSCTVLNWMHPKFMDFLDGMKQAKKEDEERKAAKNNIIDNAFENRFNNDTDSKKDEVRA